MPNKFRKSAKKKNGVWKLTQYLVYVRKPGLLSRLRKPGFISSDRPCAITIGTDGLTEEQIEFLKESERKGLIPKITWIESSPNSFDDKMKFALLCLHSDDAKEEGYMIKKRYDYAWIKIVMDSNKMPNRYDKYTHMSTPNFVDYIKSLGFTDIAGSKTINKAMAHARWVSEANKIVFQGFYTSLSESKRRNRIAQKFLEIMIEI